ncbi:UNVERIFIED_CONTAM: hypothetical protein NCL1_37124 [Trichonephila clavipes]
MDSFAREDRQNKIDSMNECSYKRKIAENPKCIFFIIQENKISNLKKILLQISKLEKPNHKNKSDNLRNPIKMSAENVTFARKLFVFSTKILIIEPVLSYILEEWI